MVPECDDEGVVALKHIILSRPQGEDEWNRFHAALEREREKRQVIELCKDARLEILKRLGSSLQTIINDLYEARRGAATKEVLQKSAAAISNADLSSSDLWWQHVAPLFREFCSLTHLKEIQVYTRRHSRFERWVPYITKASERKRLAVRNVACHFEGSDWICVKANEGSFRSLLDLLELRDETVHLFRTEHRPVGTALSTLFVIRGQITDSNRQLIREFCTAVGTRTDVASMIFRMSEAQTNYRISVGAIAHSFRMPLQTILSDLHDLAELPGLEENRMDQRLSDSIDRVIDARMDIKILLEEASEQREDIEVSGFVSRITDDFQAMAVRKHCEIIPKEPWASGMVVRANGYRLNRAIANLIDNAVKYSWNDHEIWVWVECYGTYARIRISNYGIGIPPDTRERIMQLGVRGEVPDSGHERSGSGWGLAIANSTFVDHGGWLDVESFPDDNVTTRKPGEEYHRYITEVRAYLPLK
jgi:signal transduction histidine kinase